MSAIKSCNSLPVNVVLLVYVTVVLILVEARQHLRTVIILRSGEYGAARHGGYL